jgi:hypothetical protein
MESIEIIYTQAVDVMLLRSYGVNPNYLLAKGGACPYNRVIRSSASTQATLLVTHISAQKLGGFFCSKQDYSWVVAS